MFKPGDRVVIIYDHYITNKNWMQIYPEFSVVELTEKTHRESWKTNKWNDITRAVVNEKNIILEEVYESELYKIMKEEK